MSMNVSCMFVVCLLYVVTRDVGLCGGAAFGAAGVGIFFPPFCVKCWILSVK